VKVVVSIAPSIIQGTCRPSGASAATIGVIAGYFSLVVTGLTNAGPALTVGVTWPWVISAALSLGLTSGLMVLLKSPHPPAGATTLIISLGLLTQPIKLVILMLAVVLLTVQAFVINRLAGIDYPLWNPRTAPASQKAQDGSSATAADTRPSEACWGQRRRRRTAGCMAYR
jgi:CBS-domain-containing membrane protein